MRKLNILGGLLVCSGIYGIINGFINSFIYIPIGIAIALIGFFCIGKAAEITESKQNQSDSNSVNADVTLTATSDANLKTEVSGRNICFNDMLTLIPNFPICSDGEKVEKLKCFNDKISHARITVKTDIQKLNAYVAIDIETTSLNISCDIIEVAAVRFRNFEPVEKFSILTKPPRKVTPKITDITGITNEMLEDSPRFYQIVPSLQEFIGNDNIVAHNIDFDIPRLIVHGLNLNNRKFYDTLDLAKKLLIKPSRKWDKDLGQYKENNEQDYDVINYKLDTLLEYYYINVPTHHRALHDACATGILFQRMLGSI